MCSMSHDGEKVNMNELGGRAFIGACRYCGQISSDQPPGLKTQEEADEWVTDRCRCTSATLARNLRDRIEEAKERVRELWGEGCERYGFEPVEHGIVQNLCDLVELAAAGTIRSTTIQTVDHGKASISVSAKGTIKVARIEARACQLEA